MRHLFFALALFALVATVFYYSWLPSPGFENESYMPGWVLWFTDEFDNIRTAIPFLLMGLVVGLWLRVTKARELYYWLALAGMVLLVTVAEIGQLWIPRRSFDLADIGWGGVGAAVGLGISKV